MCSQHLSPIHLILTLMMVGLSLQTMKCYICHTNDNRLCNNDTLRDCPPGQAYDRCMTRILKNAPDGLHIKKECALAPCHLRDPKLDFISFTDQCKNNDDDCIHCCDTDGCNTDGVSLTTSAHSSMVLSVIAINVLSLYSIPSFKFD